MFHKLPNSIENNIQIMAQELNKQDVLNEINLTLMLRFKYLRTYRDDFEQIFQNMNEECRRSFYHSDDQDKFIISMLREEGKMYECRRGGPDHYKFVTIDDTEERMLDIIRDCDEIIVDMLGESMDDLSWEYMEKEDLLDWANTRLNFIFADDLESELTDLISDKWCEFSSEFDEEVDR